MPWFAALPVCSGPASGPRRWCEAQDGPDFLAEMADFLADFVLGLLGVKEPWGVNNEKLSPFPFPGCFLTSLGNSVGCNLRLEYFVPEDGVCSHTFPTSGLPDQHNPQSVVRVGSHVYIRRLWGTQTPP